MHENVPVIVPFRLEIHPDVCGELGGFVFEQTRQRSGVGMTVTGA